jgi:hypothetical protein
MDDTVKYFVAINYRKENAYKRFFKMDYTTQKVFFTSKQDYPKIGWQEMEYACINDFITKNPRREILESITEDEVNKWLST